MRAEENVMSLILLDMPGEPAELVRFLEEKIARPKLSQLIAELQAARAALDLPEDKSSPDLDRFLGQQRQQVLEQGLSGLNEDEIQSLLRFPQLMWDLQDLILDEGGNYWLELMNRGVERTTLPSEIITTLAGRKSAPTPRMPQADHQSHSSVSRSWTAVLATLAALLLAMVGYQVLTTPKEPTWGFSQPGVFDKTMDSPAYLNHLAEVAETWFKKRPDSKVLLAKRLSEFRIGCTQLLAAEHAPLSSEDREWLLERCQKWISKIDGHLADLQGDDKTFSTIQQEADATIESLQKTLRERAEGLNA
jgi:hypothetical protein